MAEGDVAVIRRIVWCLVFSVLLVVLIGCSKGPDPSVAIVGEWRHDSSSGGGITYVFYKNGTFDVLHDNPDAIDPASQGAWNSGKYEFVTDQDKPAIRMVYTDKASGFVSDLTAPFVFDESGNLVFQWPESRDMQYTRVK